MSVSNTDNSSPRFYIPQKDAVDTNNTVDSNNTTDTNTPSPVGWAEPKAMPNVGMNHLR